MLRAIAIFIKINILCKAALNSGCDVITPINRNSILEQAYFSIHFLFVVITPESIFCSAGPCIFFSCSQLLVNYRNKAMQ